MENRTHLYNLIMNKTDRPDQDSCHLWQGCTDRHGYSKYSHKGKTYQVHRLLYEMTHNIKIPKGMVCMHQCSNRHCVNPNHIVLGTQKQNVRQAMAEGKYEGRKRKLNAEKVKEIRELYEKGMKSLDLAEMFEVEISTIKSIVNYRSWKKI